MKFIRLCWIDIHLHYQMLLVGWVWKGSKPFDLTNSSLLMIDHIVPMQKFSCTHLRLLSFTHGESSRRFMIMVTILLLNMLIAMMGNVRLIQWSSRVIRKSSKWINTYCLSLSNHYQTNPSSPFVMHAIPASFFMYIYWNRLTCLFVNCSTIYVNKFFYTIKNPLQMTDCL